MAGYSHAGRCYCESDSVGGVPMAIIIRARMLAETYAVASQPTETRKRAVALLSQNPPVVSVVRPINFGLEKDWRLV